jgi:hypothetical protein
MTPGFAGNHQLGQHARAKVLAANRLSRSEVEAERSARDPSHPKCQISVLAVEQKLVERVKAAHGNHRGGEDFHTSRMRPEN